jgi:hypothetical protein
MALVEQAAMLVLALPCQGLMSRKALPVLQAQVSSHVARLV